MIISRNKLPLAARNFSRNDWTQEDLFGYLEPRLYVFSAKFTEGQKATDRHDLMRWIIKI